VENFTIVCSIVEFYMYCFPMQPLRIHFNGKSILSPTVTMLIENLYVGLGAFALTSCISQALIFVCNGSLLPVLSQRKGKENCRITVYFCDSFQQIGAGNNSQSSDIVRPNFE